MEEQQVSKKSEKDWKDALLRSSLPLEQLVSEKLEDMRMGISGVYSYIRPKDENGQAEFSVDLHAYQHFRRKSHEGILRSKLSYLIECKYNHPSVQWVFSPYYRNTSMFL